MNRDGPRREYTAHVWTLRLHQIQRGKLRGREALIVWLNRGIELLVCISAQDLCAVIHGITQAQLDKLIDRFPGDKSQLPCPDYIDGLRQSVHLLQVELSQEPLTVTNAPVPTTTLEVPSSSKVVPGKYAAPESVRESEQVSFALILIPRAFAPSQDTLAKLCETHLCGFFSQH